MSIDLRIFAFALCSACAGPPRPVLMHSPDALPSDPQKRADARESARARPGPEGREMMSPELQRVEKGAAIAAAALGMLFSESDNVTIGVLMPIDENLLFEGGRRAPEGAGDEEDEDEGDSAPSPDSEATDLLPWIELP